MNADAIYRVFKHGTPAERQDLARALPPSPFKEVAGAWLVSEQPGMAVVALGSAVIDYCNGSAPEVGAELALALHGYAVELFEGTPDHGLLATTLSGLADNFVKASNLLGRPEDVLEFTDKFIPFYEKLGETENLPALKLGRITALLDLMRLDDAAKALEDLELSGNPATDLELERLRARMRELLAPITTDRSRSAAPPGPASDDFVARARRAQAELQHVTRRKEFIDKLSDAPRTDLNDPDGFEKLLLEGERSRAEQPRRRLDRDRQEGKPRFRGQRAKPPVHEPPPPDEGGVLSVETPGMKPEAVPPPQPSGDETAEPSEARWMNAEIAGHPPDQPLGVGESYVLEFGVDVTESGDASARIPDAKVLFGDGEETIELTVQLDSDTFDIEQHALTLKVPRRGQSKGKARFDITPKRIGRLNLTATIHKEGNFLMQMEIAYSVGEVAAESAGRVAHGRTIAAAAQLQPRELGMTIKPAAGGGYECTVYGAVATRVTLPISETELGDAVTTARNAMMDVVTQRDDASKLVFQTGLDVDDASEAKALRTLARAGATLFQRIFFGPLAGADVQKVGDWLRKRATRAGERLTLQIVAERFPIPWGLLYVGKVGNNEKLDWDLFLGMRHIIEQIPLQTNLGVDDTVIHSDNPSLAVSVNVNAGIDTQMKTDVVARQLKFWGDSATTAGVRMRVAQRRSRADVLAALSGKASDQLMYLYCHAITSGPGDPGGINGSCFVFTGDERLTLEDLNIEAPMTDALPGNPLVFINACESAELTPAFYDGFVPYFMAKGARGVVGTECKTPALFATEWALQFFPRFLGGEPLGQLFLDLRRAFRERHGNPLGLLYAVYCDGDTRVQPSLTI